MKYNNIIFYIYTPSEKSAYIKTFPNCSEEEKNKVSDILEKNFDNLFSYNTMSDCKIYSSGWILTHDIHDTCMRYEDTIDLFHYKRRENLLNHISDIQKIFKSKKSTTAV